MFPVPVRPSGISAGSDRSKCTLPSGAVPPQAEYFEFKGAGIQPYHCTFVNDGTSVTVTAHGGTCAVAVFGNGGFCL